MVRLPVSVFKIQRVPLPIPLNQPWACIAFLVVTVPTLLPARSVPVTTYVLVMLSPLDLQFVISFDSSS